MNKIFYVLVLIGLFISPIANAETLSAVPEKSITINNTGHVTIKGAQVQQLAGRSFFTRVYWGEVFLRVLVRTGANTKFTRYSGGVSTLSDVAEGDYINIEGDLTLSTSNLDVTATTVQNWSLKTDQSKFSGKVSAISEGKDGFSLVQKDGTTLSVRVSTNTTINKGNLVIPFDRLKVGDTILSASGTYNLTSNTLEADAIRTYVDRSIYWPKNFSGTLKSVSSNTLPAILVITVGNTDYTVNVPANALVWNNAKSNTSLSRFMPGDSIRFYGKLREALDPVIDAEVVRNTSL